MKNGDERGQTLDSDSHSFSQPSMRSCHHTGMCSKSILFQGIKLEANMCKTKYGIWCDMWLLLQ